jgi:hypothetical protein
MVQCKQDSYNNKNIDKEQKRNINKSISSLIKCPENYCRFTPI